MTPVGSINLCSVPCIVDGDDDAQTWRNFGERCAVTHEIKLDSTPNANCASTLMHMQWRELWFEKSEHLPFYKMRGGCVPLMVIWGELSYILVHAWETTRSHTYPRLPWHCNRREGPRAPSGANEHGSSRLRSLASTQHTANKSRRNITRGRSDGSKPKHLTRELRVRPFKIKRQWRL